MAQGGLSGGVRRGELGLRTERASARKFYGLVELDQVGTVLYTRFEEDGAAALSERDCTGRNFYTEVAPFRNVDEFRQRVEAFGKGSVPAVSMDFTCDYEDGPAAVRVLLARIRERADRDVTKSILVHVRRA